MCPHDYATIVIMFYSFCFNRVPSKNFRMAYGDSCVDPAENQKLLHPVNYYFNSQKGASDLILFSLDWYTNCLGLLNLVGFLEFRKYTFDTYYYIMFCF